MAYVRDTYEDNSIGWMLVAAMSKIADEDMTIVIKELKGVKLATILAHRVCKALNIEKSNTYYFCDNTVVIDQVNSCREKGINGLTRGVGNLIAKIAHEIPEGLKKNADLIDCVKTNSSCNYYYFQAKD